MKTLSDYIIESSNNSQERIKQCEKIANWLSIDTFPKLDERKKIKLEDDWYCVLNHVKFSNSDNPLIYISIVKDNKEYIYYSGKRYGKSQVDWGQDTTFEQMLEKYLYDVKSHNNWFEAQAYNTTREMKDLKYKDKDFSKIEEIDITDINI